MIRPSIRSFMLKSMSTSSACSKRFSAVCHGAGSSACQFNDPIIPPGELSPTALFLSFFSLFTSRTKRSAKLLTNAVVRCLKRNGEVIVNILNTAPAVLRSSDGLRKISLRIAFKIGWVRACVCVCGWVRLGIGCSKCVIDSFQGRPCPCSRERTRTDSPHSRGGR